MKSKISTMKVVGGALAVAGIGIAGYYGYRLYSANKEKSAPTVGALTDGYADHNSRKASAYWRRMRELHLEQERLRAMGL